MTAQKSFDVSRMREIIEENGETKASFARSIGVCKSTVQAWMKGRTVSIRSSILSSISAHYGVSVDWLMGKTDMKEIEPSGHRSRRERLTHEMYRCSVSELNDIQAFYEKITGGRRE